MKDEVVYQHEDGSFGDEPIEGVSYYEENRAERRAREAVERRQIRAAKREIARLTRGSIFEES